MPRGPNKKAKQAEELYKQGIKLADIAKQLDVPAGTVRRWKSTYKWEPGQSERSLSNPNVRKKERPNSSKIDEPEIEQITCNSKLTDKQQLFCIYYIRKFNATKAYQKAYGVSYAAAAASGPRLLENVRIKEEINKLKQYKFNREFFNEADLFQKYIDIANADITDFLEITKKGISIRNGEEIDGTLISEISQGKNGIKIKLSDRMKAMQWLSDHMDLATEKQKAEVALLKAKLETPEEEIQDDGFIDALNAAAETDWSDEEVETDI